MLMICEKNQNCKTQKNPKMLEITQLQNRSSTMGVASCLTFRIPSVYEGFHTSPALAPYVIIWGRT